MPNHKDRARELLASMNIEEKVAQLMAVWVKISPDGSFALRDLQGFSIQDSAQDARTIMPHGIGQITRPLGTHAISARDGIRGLNAIQKYLIEQTRLGIPALPHEECLAGVMAEGATLFPAGINFGALWDADLVEKIGQAIGNELASIGAKQGLAPVLDVSRDARWGRTEETLGEDPYLAGTLATSYVRGLQGPDRRVLATLKHFVGHSFSEGGRNHAPVRVGERELNDTFLLPFEMAVKLANAGSVMPAYHDIDGEPSSASRRYITDILRNKWGFDGIVVSDYEAISLLYDHHHVAKDAAEAAALALHAGIDVELPGFTCYRTGIETALKRGILSIQDVDEAVMRVLIEKSRLGLFEKPYADEGAISFGAAEHRAIAVTAAEKSIVLLKNDGVLPIDPAAAKSGLTALIGPLADERNAMYCGYSFPVHVAYAPNTAPSAARWGLTLREAMTAELGGDHITFQEGCKLVTERPANSPVFPGDAAVSAGQKFDILSRSTDDIANAVAVAAKADRIIVAVGDIAGLFLTGTVGEGSDASSLTLPGVQHQLLDALLDTGKPVIIVLINGRPYNLGSAGERAAAVVEAWLPGQEGGKAITDILLGNRAPSGRLPVSVPKSAGAMPYFYNHKLKSAGTPVQREFGAIYPFGFGLTYTTFEYASGSVEQTTVPVDGEIVVKVAVKNSGPRDGEEIVQLYVRDILSSLVRPVKELKGFKRVAIPSARTAEITFHLPTDMLAFSISGTERIVEPGEFEIMLGSSSEDIHYRAIVNVTGKARTLPEKWRMQSAAEVAIV